MVIAELILTVAVVAIAVTLMSFVVQRQRRLTEHTRIIAKALENPAYDRATIESLAFQLTGRRPPAPSHPEAARRNLMAWVLAIGWLLMFIGIGVGIAGESCHDNDMVVGGIVTGLIGFAFVTYPFALRELEARRAA